MLSIANSISSHVSASVMSSEISTYGAEDRLITIFREDLILKPLHHDALEKVAAERLELSRLCNQTSPTQRLRPPAGQEAFRRLTLAYKAMRNSWLSSFSSRNLTSIRLVHFEGYRSCLVDIR